MKKIFSIFLLSFLYMTMNSQNSIKLKDGFYEVVQLGYDTTHFIKSKQNQQLISFNGDFTKDETQAYQKVLVLIDDFVPLELEKLPSIEKQNDSRKKLLVTMNASSAEKLKIFTAARVMKQVVIVMDGEALTVSKIKVPISSGNFEITRCNDNACEKLYVRMKQSLKK